MSGFPVQQHNIFEAIWAVTADSACERWQDDPRLHSPEGQRAVLELAEQAAYEDYARSVKQEAERRFRL